MQRITFMMGVALLVVAGTLAISITLRKPMHRSPSGPNASSEPEGGRSPSSEVLPTVRSSSKSSRTLTDRTPPSEYFSVSAPQDHPQRALLSEKARKVEAEAKTDLERLTKSLELTGEQRRRLFPILARTSKEYDPALTIAGLPVGAPALLGPAGDREVNQVLDPPQRDQLIEDALTDQALWEEIIGKLRHKLDQETPQVPAGEDEVPAPAPRRRGNLFESVEEQ